MPNKVVHFKSIGKTTFAQNKRSKNIKISVKPDKSVLVSFPFFVSSEEVVGFVKKNEAWILKQQQKFDAGKQQYFDGLEIKTRMFRLIFKKHQKTFRKVNKDEITVFVENFRNDNCVAFIESNFVEVYRYEAHMILPKRIEELAEKFDFDYNRVTIRNNKRNWGSCSSKNNISLNLQMMKLPDELIDYILLHELVHTKIKNHGSEFWDKLNKCTNFRARDLAKEVKKYSTYSM